MRFDRLIIVLVLAAWGCKAPQTATNVGSSYEEDITALRPPLEDVEVKPIPMEETIVKAVVPQGHLRAEMDSISGMIVNNNKLPRTEQGYTIQLYNGPSREAATKMIAEFSIRFPNIPTEMVYFQPDFKVKAGKYLNRVEAYETFERVKKDFSEVLLVPEKIKLNYE